MRTVTAALVLALSFASIARAQSPREQCADDCRARVSRNVDPTAELARLERQRAELSIAGPAVATIGGAVLVVGGVMTGLVGAMMTGFAANGHAEDVGNGITIGGLIGAGIGVLALVPGAISWALTSHRQRALSRAIDELRLQLWYVPGGAAIGATGRF